MRSKLPVRRPPSSCVSPIHWAGGSVKNLSGLPIDEASGLAIGPSSTWLMKFLAFFSALIIMSRGSGGHVRDGREFIEA